MRKFARFAVRRRWIVIGAWIALVVALQATLSGLGGSHYKDDFKLPHTETDAVSKLLTASGLDSQNGSSGTMVLHARTGGLADSAAKVQPALRQLCTAGLGLSSVESPYGTVDCRTGRSTADRNAQAALTSPDRTIGLVNINWAATQPTVSQIDGSVEHFAAAYTGGPLRKTAAEALDQLKGGALQVEFTGEAYQQMTPASSGFSPELIGFLAALVILLLVFRALAAAVLPLLSATAAILSGLPLIGILSHAMSVASFADQLALLMILGVGVDYALFIVTRHRRNLLHGMSVEDSILHAVDTSGRAVLFAGTTVCIALLGMWALGVNFLYGVSLGTAIGVALTMAASLTLLPAMLRFLGLKVLPRRQRKAVRAGIFDLTEHQGLWYRWARLVQRRPVALGVLAAIVLGVLAIPFFSMRLGSADQGSNRRDTTTRKGYDLIAQGFGPGYNSGLQLVISGPGSADRAFLGRITERLKTVPDVAPGSVQALPTGKGIGLVTFKSVTTPQDAKTTALVKDLRSHVLPPLYLGSPNHIYVYGITAIYVDFAKVLSAKMALFFLAVIGLSFLLLMIAFRSLVIPLTAAVMNLLAAGASFGIVVAIFQWGWLSEILKIGGGGPIEAFIPVMFFAILFGLSMDYQVFLVSRIHEEWQRTGDNARAITVGQGETGGIITAAGLIMIAVFGGFVLGDDRAIKLFGIGLGSAVLLDAFIVRTVLVPALMHVIGKANWYLPKQLAKTLPQVSIEAHDATQPEEDEKVLTPV
jgi:RND superfamily putative drug exporter